MHLIRAIAEIPVDLVRAVLALVLGSTAGLVAGAAIAVATAAAVVAVHRAVEREQIEADMRAHAEQAQQ